MCAPPFRILSPKLTARSCSRSTMVVRSHSAAPSIVRPKPSPDTISKPRQKPTRTTERDLRPRNTRQSEPEDDDDWVVSIWGRSTLGWTERIAKDRANELSQDLGQRMAPEIMKACDLDKVRNMTEDLKAVSFAIGYLDEPAPVKVARREEAQSFAMCLARHGFDARLQSMNGLPSIWEILGVLGYLASPIGWASTAALLRGTLSQNLPAYTLDRHDIYFYGNKVKKRRFFQRMSTMGAYWITER